MLGSGNTGPVLDLEFFEIAFLVADTRLYIYGIWNFFGREGHYTTLVLYGILCGVVFYRLFVNMAQPGLLTVSSIRSRCLQIVAPWAKDLHGCHSIIFASNDVDYERKYI